MTESVEGLITIGASAGGLAVLTEIWRAIGKTCRWPVALVQHFAAGGDEFLASHLSRFGEATVASSNTILKSGRAHIAPVNYHLLIESRESLALSVDPPVHHCRPAIDPLFFSAAEVFGERLIAVVLTGANRDGAQGAAYVEARGGTVWVQDPAEAEVPVMPQAVLAECQSAKAFSTAQLIEQIMRRVEST